MAKKGFRKIKYKPELSRESFETVQMESESSSSTLAIEINDEIVAEPVQEESNNELAIGPIKKVNFIDNFKKWISDSSPKEDVESEVDSIEIIDEVTNSPEMKYFEAPEKNIEENIMESRTTVIAENVEITGDVKIEGNLEFYGKITGNIDSQGDISMANSAYIEGKLIGNNLNIADGNVNGDLKLSQDANFGTQSRIMGNVHAKTLISSGMIVGNVYISGKVVLNETSVIEGNIQAKELEVKAGAVIKGQIDIDAK